MKPFDPMSVSPDDEIDWEEFELSSRIANAFRRYPYYTKSDKENLHCPGGCWYNEKPRKVKTYLDLKIYLHELDNDNVFHDIRGLGAVSMIALRVWFKQFDPMFEAAFKNHNKEGIHYITEEQLCEIVHAVDKLIGMSIPRLKVYDMTIKDDMIKALSSIGIEIEKDYYKFMKSIQ